MRISVLQHEPNEWIGSMESWFAAKHYAVSTCMVYQNKALPELDDFDWLLIMGGNMSVYQEEEYPWLIDEKELIREAIKQGKKVLGICLGGQLIASALGAEVFANKEMEIGWHAVEKTNAVASWCPDKLIPLSWHGDRFELPSGAIAFAQSTVTPYQGFCYGNQVWALQFHLEATALSVPDFYAVCEHQLPDGQYVQSYDDLQDRQYLENSKAVMYALLNYLNEV